ncbi:hypothetical protein H4687_009253 [Streptomyces stelliscabiei]|uniref:Uncharacterized protein n=1 Tax=Streptomyces stelliscabiei TaxID=146820 RepID=A0A8I0PGD3_9ACTN|nr:hypothetical protein [Streptomyces stelliscabiei]
MQRPGREISPPSGAVPFGRDVARSEPGQGTMHQPGPGDGHRILRAPPLRCRAVPADVVHRVESTARASGAVAPTEWGPLRTMSSTPGRWRAPAVRASPIAGAVVRTRCGAAVRTAGAAAGMVRAPSVPGAYRGARRARSGARCRRQEESDRAEFLYHTAPCPPSGQSPEYAPGARARVAGHTKWVRGRVRQVRTASTAGRCAPAQAGDALGARTEDVVRAPEATGARTLTSVRAPGVRRPGSVAHHDAHRCGGGSARHHRCAHNAVHRHAGACDAMDAGMFHSPPASAHQSGVHFHPMRTTVDSTLRPLHRRAARRTPGEVRRVRSGRGAPSCGR